MSVTPLHDRVLIKPIVPPLSDLIAVPDGHYEPEQMGEVIALGDGIESRRTAVHRAINAVIERIQAAFPASTTSDAARRFLQDQRDDYRPDHVCHVGDVVCFSPKHGQELQIDGESYLMLREDDLLAVIEPEPA